MTVHHPVFARVYRLLAPMMEQHGVAEHRRRLLAGLSGRVIEVGAGPGGNFRHYPPTVTEVVAVEPEPTLLETARRAAADAPVPVEVREGVAERLPAEDDGFDAAVASLVLCSVADPAGALGEVARALRDGGELRFYEHVLADEPRLARTQQRADVVWPRLFGGCRTSRDTVATIEGLGFVVDEIERFRFPPSRLFVPAAPHVLGRATLGVERGG